ncbi:uncharacterized protein LOC128245562 isoform X2 [Mya arenaria]|uniref:uncharacterized protein LOC128245562 isoform X2 n=1 Tax=Mya arenaria TaxID=6604 RepID=UPI0022DED6E4|nr:uncharacterized protein LOC128245562 isoform X2 [Mya arenaria]
MEYMKAAKTLLWLGILTCMISLLSLGIGIGLVTQGAWFPYDVGGGIIAGVFGLFLSICPICMYRDFVNGEDSSCCAIGMTIYFAIAILAMVFSFGVSGVYAVIECVAPSSSTIITHACNSPQHDTLLALSILTLIVTGVLTVLSLAVFFTCCCNASKFGVPLTSDYVSGPDPSYERTVRQIEHEWLEERRRERLERERQEENRVGNLDEWGTNTDSHAPSFVDISSAQPSAPPVEPNPLANLPPSYEEVMANEDKYKKTDTPRSSNV